MQVTPTIDADIGAMTPEAASAFLRTYKRKTLRQVRTLVETCCRAEKVDQRLATILEDIGQEFIGLSYPINEAAYAQQAARKAARRHFRAGGESACCRPSNEMSVSNSRAGARRGSEVGSR